MSEAKHTAGPWATVDHVKPDSPPGRSRSMQFVLTEDGTAIAHVYIGGPGPTEMTWDEVKANGRLIAAAPDLLAACEMYAVILRSMPPPQLGGWNWPLILEQTTRAIDKAKGV